MLGPGFFALIPITAIVLTFIVVMKILQILQTNAQASRDSASSRKVDALLTHLAERDRATDALEERIRVLERIVTDKGPRLSDEIERLRA